MAQLLVYLFPAILPPHDAVDFEYYQVLGIPKKSSASAIRNSYKKQSLKYHPDKATDRVSSVVIYEKIQEAHNALKDDAKRNLYHNVGCSVARFRFLENAELLNPVLVHQNLLRASYMDKSRLILVAVILIGILLLQPILLAIKINGNHLQNISWRNCFIPLFLLQGLYWMMRMVLVWWDHDILGVLETTGWYVSTLLLFGYQLDADDPLDYRLVAIPFFVSITFRVLSYVFQLRSIRITQASMVSEQYMAEVVHPEQDETAEDDDDPDYIVVHADEPAVVAAMGLMDRPPSREEIEALRVQTSPEFQSAEAAATSTRQNVTRWLVIFLPFAILITLKLCGTIASASWWLVFLPMWIMVFVRLCRNLFVCLCLVPPGLLEEVEPLGEVSTDDHNVPTSHYFKEAESEMSVFAEWDGDNLTSDRIEKVRTDGMGMADIEEGGATSGDNEAKEEDAQARDSDNIASEANVATETDVGNGTTTPGEEPKPSETRGDEQDEEKGAYQPMEEDEAEYAQTKFQSCTVSCSLCLELIVLCLVVGLIQNPGAYNAFWVLFPVFLVSAAVLACVCCCVYAKELPSMPDIDEPDDENQNLDADNPETGGEKAVATADNESPADVATLSDSPADQDNAGDGKDGTEHSAMDELD